MTSWEINVFSDTRLLSRQNPAVKWNTNWFWAAKEVIQLSSRCLSPFSKSKMKIYKTYEGHKTQFFFLFWSPKSESKNKDWFGPEIPAFQMLSRVMAHISSLRGPKITRLELLEEDLIFYNFSRNRDFWIHTFSTSNLARNIRIGRNTKQRRELS